MINVSLGCVRPKLIINNEWMDRDNDAGMSRVDYEGLEGRYWFWEVIFEWNIFRVVINVNWKTHNNIWIFYVFFFLLRVWFGRSSLRPWPPPVSWTLFLILVGHIVSFYIFKMSFICYDYLGYSFLRYIKTTMNK